MEGGTYTLLLALARETTITFGARGDRKLSSGAYAYTGSARGASGFARVDRHHRIASGDDDTRHWHIDYLLGHDATTIRTVVRAHGADIECLVARALTATESVEPVPGIGASDCSCPTHLHYADDHARLLDAVRQAHRTHGE